jgi:FtsP/CotA-like multicopper oxidase with cupredoxin domain
VYPLWSFLHGFLLVVGTGALAVVAVLQWRRVERSRAAASAALLLVVGALVVVLAQVGVLLALAGYGPDFALEKVPLGIPLALLALVAAVAVPGLSRASAGQPGPRAAAALAVRLALVAQLLAWHLYLVSPTSTTAVLGTGLAYAAVLVVSVPLLRPRGAHPSTGRSRAARVAGGGLVAVAAAGLAVTVADRANRAPAAAHAGHAGLAPGEVDVATLTGPSGTPDRALTLTARRDGDRWTFDGTVPGPELRFRLGELVQVTLVNRDVPGGVTLHWHGLDVPNAEDGVAGVTQDAVEPGSRYVYRFRPEQVGTFWYHSHQASSEQVARGLFGVVVIEPRQRATGADIAVVDHARVTGTLRRDVEPGTPVRLRVVNATSSLGRYSLAGTPYRLVAVDGTDLSGPAEIDDRRLALAAGGRYDLTFRMPAGPVTLRGAAERVELRPPGNGAPLPRDRSRGTVDLLHYGTPVPTPFDAGSPVDRDLRLVIDQRLAFGGHGFGVQWSMNGRVWPDGPVFTVREGELVRMTIANRSIADHPMHLHGHHALVLSRDGGAATGSPRWTDTLEVGPGQTYVLLFRADNPGIWMDHCHNLDHARAGFVLHLSYADVGTRFQVGPGTGNDPE